MESPKITRPIDAPKPRPDLEPVKRQAIERVLETLRKSVEKNPNITLRVTRKR